MYIVPILIGEVFYQYPQVLLCKIVLNHITPQPVLILRIALTQFQDLPLGLVEPHEVHTVPLLQLVRFSSDDIWSLWHVNWTIQFCVVCKLASC